MKVFVSWSGSTSRAVAEALADWFPKVIQGVHPFVSAKDIDKGANWTVELARELEDAEFGIVCLAPDNLQSPWLNYETGAITRSVNSRVCPVLFGVTKAEVKPPMSQLQLTAIDKEDMSMLMSSMNKVAGEPINHDALMEAVDVWWPQLEKKLETIAAPKTVKGADTPTEPAKPQVDVNEMIEEVLHRVRNLDDRMRRVERVSTARPESPRVNRMRLAQEQLRRAAAESGIEVESMRTGSSGIDLRVEGPLPDILPPDLLRLALNLSNELDLRIRLVAPNRVATFENGTTDETPF